MSISDIRQALFDTNLNFDPQMANEVQAFLNTHAIQKNQGSIHLKALASAAILSQIKMVPQVNNQGFTGYGITLQSIMAHLNGYSKQEFLQIISQITLKDQSIRSKLSTKIRNVQLSYRLFKKYRKSFQQLWLLTGKGTLVMNDMLSIFWVIYLLIKNKNDDIYLDLQYQIKLIVILLKSVFQYWISHISNDQLHHVLDQNFNTTSIAEINSNSFEDVFLIHHINYLNEIQNLYGLRYSDMKIDFQRFSKNAIQIARYLDDITNHFYKEKSYFQVENYIDDISFLQLKKILAPKPISRSTNYNSIEPINKQLNFTQDEINNMQQNQDKKQNFNKSNQDIPSYSQKPSISNLNSSSHYVFTQNLPLMTPFRNKGNSINATPCSNRLQNLQWIRNCLDLMNREQLNQLFRKIFGYCQKQSLVIFQLKAKKHLLLFIQEFTPKCIKKDKRVQQMYAFFRFFVFKIFKRHQSSQNNQMFSNSKTFDSILCLSADLFNFAYSSTISSYRQLCRCFDVPLIDAIKPINWIGKNVEMPKQLNAYLYTLEKRILIKEIWEDQTGENLIRSQQNFIQQFQIGYTDLVIWKRLIKHIFDRAEQLAKQVNIPQSKLIKRVQNLIHHILRYKPHLLYKNKIDQIIICCMTSFLSINQIHQKTTLEKVFRDYTKIEMSYNLGENSLIGNNGKEMTLSDYYNDIFLPEIQNIVKQNSAGADFLLTPIRQSQYSLKRQGQLTPFSKKFKQNQIDFVQNKKLSFSAFSFNGNKLGLSAGLSQSIFKKDPLQNAQGGTQNLLMSYRKKLFIRNRCKEQEQESQQKSAKSEQKSEQRCQQIMRKKSQQQFSYDFSLNSFSNKKIRSEEQANYKVEELQQKNSPYFYVPKQKAVKIIQFPKNQ